MRKTLQIFALGLLVGLMFSNLGFAQSEGTTQHSGISLTEQFQGKLPVVPFQQAKDESILWDNIDNTGATSGIVSTHLAGLDPGLVETADDFVLEEGEWLITRVEVRGFKSTGTDDPTQFGVRVYADNSGVPGDLLFTEIIDNAFNTEGQNLVLTEELVLSGGTYWLTVYGYYAAGTALASTRWNWKTWAGTIGNETMLRDHPDLFGAGATDWTTLSELGVTNATSTDFAIYGMENVASDFAVTFNVDVTDVAVEVFDPASHKIFIAGSFPGDNEWNMPGSNAALEMTKVTAKSKLPTTLTESFEDFADFTTDLTPWTTIQVSEGDTYASSSFDFTNEGTAFAFMAFNPASTVPAITDTHPAQDGNKYAVAVQYEGTDDDKWLISPQMLGTATSALSFYAKSITHQYGAERFQVMISTTDTDPASFTKISEGEYLEAPLEWTKFEFDLSAYDADEFYFAIHYVSYDAFIFMVDNIVVTAEGGGDESIYTITLDLPAADYAYKYFVVKEANSWDNGEWVGDPNRTVTVAADMVIDDVWGDKPSGLDEITNEGSTTLYPNPATFELNVVHSSRISEIRVFDVTGRMVYNSPVNNLSTTKVDVSRFNQGIYILQVVAQDGITSKKFAVKK